MSNANHLGGAYKYSAEVAFRQNWCSFERDNTVSPQLLISECRADGAMHIAGLIVPM